MMESIWAKIDRQFAAVKERPIVSLFDKADRFEMFSEEVDDLLLDYSKTNMDETTLALLIELAEQAGVPAKRDAMFAGEKINSTENRAVLHTALRANSTTPLLVDDKDVRPDIAQTLDRMEQFVTGIHSGKITTPEGRRFTDVINLSLIHI